MKTPDMNFSDIAIVEHPAFAADECWMVFRRDAPQVPCELRATLPVPCILTGDVEQTQHMLTFLQAVTELKTLDASTQPTTAAGLLNQSDPLASLRKASSR
jgi:hypothetical protein